MLIGILHYHLHGGGVTRVIETTARLLSEQGHHVVVACGEQPEKAPVSNIIVHGSLAYNIAPEAGRVKEIAREIEEKIRRIFGRKPDLWHIHNHSLGKNTTLPLLADYWANRGMPLLFHIHDFSENGRPSGYHYLTRHLDSSPVLPLYPQAEHIHYATLTSRDRDILSRAGFREDHLHVLPNPVSMEQGDRGRDARVLFPECDRLVLYAVRGIRRKNLGEFFLHAILNAGSGHFAMTLAPKNPDQKKYYDPWVQFAREKSLPVTFGAGQTDRFPFPAIIQAADALLTTSIMEGFGLTFLEPWLMDRPLYGRDLPGITDDFKNHGIRLNHLYSFLPVPLDWLNVSEVKNRVREALKQAYTQYGYNYEEELLGRFWRSATRNDTIDFGRLDEEGQRLILTRLLADGTIPSELTKYRLNDNIPGAGTVAYNKECVRKNYNPKVYIERLMAIYKQLLSAPGKLPEYVDRQQVLNQFLKPERFYFIQSA